MRHWQLALLILFAGCDTKATSAANHREESPSLRIYPEAVTIAVGSTVRFSSSPTTATSNVRWTALGNQGQMRSNAVFRPPLVPGTYYVQAEAFGQTVTGMVRVVPIEPKSLWAGAFNSCLIDQFDVLKCWGLNSSSQLGVGMGEEEDIILPLRQVGENLRFKTMSGGWVHSCGIDFSSKIHCWGTGLVAPDGFSDTPVTVETDAGFRQIVAGVAHACALSTDDDVWCWGANNSGDFFPTKRYGQLGTGTSADAKEPIRVPDLPQTLELSSGGFHTCTIDVNGRVWCWGANNYGQLGNGTIDDSLSPVAVTYLTSKATKIAAGFLHTCAILESQEVRCWGANRAYPEGTLYYGQLGNSSTRNYAETPLKVSTFYGAPLMIAAAGWHTCLVTDSNTYCWGPNMEGEVGDGNYRNSKNRPAPVDLKNVKMLALGMVHSCALVEESVYCWGDDTYGQTGLASTSWVPNIVGFEE